MIVNRKLGIVGSAVAIGGTALAGVLWVGTAHAQSTDSISVTSAALGPSINSQAGQMSSEQAVLTFSVTCPANDGGYIDLTTSQGGTNTSDANKELTCTGSAQSVSVTISGSNDYAPGQVFVGASLDVVFNFGSTDSTGPFGIEAATAAIVPIQ
jgi:hypothetical protein